MSQFLGFGRGNSDKVITGTETVNIYTGCSGTTGLTALTVDNTGGFSAGDLILIHKSRGDTTTTCGTWELNRIVSVGGGLTLLIPLVNSYQDSGNEQSQCVLIPEYRGLTIQSGGILTPSAWDGNTGGILFVACNGQINVNSGGSINGVGKGFRGGSTPSGTAKRGTAGEGTVGAEIRENAGPNGNGGGGGDQSGTSPYCAQSAGGGNGAEASTGGAGGNNVGPGYGGLAVGNAALTTACFGGGGGGGGQAGATGGTVGGNGGALMTIFGRDIVVAGTINNAGNVGGNGVGAGGGGGGAGGSVLIKASAVTLGAGLITADGGTAGSGQQGGTNGATGRIRIEVCSRTGTTSPIASESIGGHNFCGSVAAII